MRLRSLFFIGAVFTLLNSCNNLEDAPTSNRNTFFKIFEGPYSITVTDVEVIPEGYAVLGNMSKPNDQVVTVIFKTDEQGQRISDFVEIEGGTGKSFTHFSNGTSGYVIVGDSIKSDPGSPIVANIDVISTRVILIDDDLNPASIRYRSFADTTVNDPNPYIADYYGESVNTTSTGEIIILGTYRDGVISQQQEPSKPFIYSLSSTLESQWVRKYDLINRNYNNARSVHYYNGKIFWASGVERIQGDLTFSYLTLSAVQNESVFVNYSLLGENSEQVFRANNIQPALNPAFGFAIIGTYSAATDGSLSNIFFLRADALGNIKPETIKYFDAIGSQTGTPVEANASQIIDSGEAVIATSDGGFLLAGTFESNPKLGKGLKDIFLIKLDVGGNTSWFKRFGGLGNEEVIAVVETPDKGILISGTSTIGTYSTPILIKTDKNGELKN